MLKKAVLLIFLSSSLMACSATHKPSQSSWRYGTGSNIDITNNTRTEFFRDGKMIYADRYAGGGAGGLLSERISERRYYWAGGGGLPTVGVPVPDKALIEMVSMYDRKRYRITVNLPADLEAQMRKSYRLKDRTVRRNLLYFGLAPGGYYEVILTGIGLGISPDLLIAHGTASEVTDDWRDKKIPISKQYDSTLADFKNKYGDLFKAYPVPKGMEWAPIMDAYRANQPKTDQHPVN
ncbi:DUF2931 family protein [Siccibacter turicensis]|uniref:DUF2931 family protein n=1 Tax=Siccibacter turicensis TaxID=357233 RepID=UPI003F547EE5